MSLRSYQRSDRRRTTGRVGLSAEILSVIINTFYCIVLLCVLNLLCLNHQLFILLTYVRMILFHLMSIHLLCDEQMLISKSWQYRLLRTVMNEPLGFLCDRCCVWYFWCFNKTTLTRLFTSRLVYANIRVEINLLTIWMRWEIVKTNIVRIEYPLLLLLQRVWDTITRLLVNKTYKYCFSDYFDRNSWRKRKSRTLKELEHARESVEKRHARLSGEGEIQLCSTCIWKYLSTKIAQQNLNCTWQTNLRRRFPAIEFRVWSGPPLRALDYNDEDLLSRRRCLRRGVGASGGNFGRGTLERVITRPFPPPPPVERPRTSSLYTGFQLERQNFCQVFGRQKGKPGIRKN